MKKEEKILDAEGNPLKEGFYSASPNTWATSVLNPLCHFSKSLELEVSDSNVNYPHLEERGGRILHKLTPEQARENLKIQEKKLQERISYLKSFYNKYFPKEK
jgi:hypothetical protein